jgi:hypothetical protein
MKEQIGLDISKDVWKFFIKAHPDCDTDAFVDEIVAGCEALCQARVEGLFKEIATECFEGTLMKGRDFNFAKWQAIKKQEGVIIKQGGDAQSN